MPRIRVKKAKEVVRIHQHWKHMRSRQSVYISQIYRHERRVLAVKFEEGAFPLGKKEDFTYISFVELDKYWVYMGAYPNAARQSS